MLNQVLTKAELAYLISSLKKNDIEEYIKFKLGHFKPDKSKHLQFQNNPVTDLDHEMNSFICDLFSEDIHYRFSIKCKDSSIVTYFYEPNEKSYAFRKIYNSNNTVNIIKDILFIDQILTK